jgi:hypothetical protein
MLDVILKRFDSPDETRVFDKGKFEIIHIGGMTIGKASYEPGWKWSEHVSPVAGTELCEVEHCISSAASNMQQAESSQNKQPEFENSDLI